jgi:hypothetical protein
MGQVSARVAAVARRGTKMDKSTMDDLLKWSGCGKNSLIWEIW